MHSSFSDAELVANRGTRRAFPLRLQLEKLRVSLELNGVPFRAVAVESRFEPPIVV